MGPREQLMNHVHSVNKVLTKEWLNEQTNEILLANCHPSDRPGYAYELRKDLETTKEPKEWLEKQKKNDEKI